MKSGQVVQDTYPSKMVVHMCEVVGLIWPFLNILWNAEKDIHDEKERVPS